MIIRGRSIGDDSSPYIVAEVSGNHGGNISRAYALISQASACGADAVKFQAYTPDTITIDHNGPGFKLSSGPWAGRTLYSLYAEAHTPFEWFPYLFQCAREHDITAFASVFDKSSVDMLEKLECPAYKIASMEIVDTALIDYAAAKGKPMMISTGMATPGDIHDVLVQMNKYEIDWTFLHCVSGYPTPPEQADLQSLGTLTLMQGGLRAGLSDHSLGSTIPIAAAALGASIIEKHLTLDRNFGGPDDGFSMEPSEFKEMVKAVREVSAALRTICEEPASANSSRVLRRSLYAVKDIAAGEVLTEDNIRSIRPAYGLPPRFLPLALGVVAPVAIPRGSPLSLDLLGMSHLSEPSATSGEEGQ